MSAFRPLSTLGSVLREAARGYGAIAGTAGKLLGFLAVIAAASAAVVVPVWLAATRFPAAFTVVTCAAFAAALAMLLGLRLRRVVRSSGGASRWLRGRLLPLAGRLGLVLVAAASVYLLALLYAARLYGAAVPSTMLLAVAVGWYARRSGIRRRPHPDPWRADDRKDGEPS